MGSRTLAKAKKFIEETGLKGKAMAYGSYDEVLDDSSVDAVYVPISFSIKRCRQISVCQGNGCVLSNVDRMPFASLSHGVSQMQQTFSSYSGWCKKHHCLLL